MNKYIKTAQSIEDPRESSLSWCGCKGSGYGREEKDSGEKQMLWSLRRDEKSQSHRKRLKGSMPALGGCVRREGLNLTGLWVLG